MPYPALDTEYKLSDNLTATHGRVFLTGTQALLRMMLAQKRADERRGLNTAGFVTGYRGSPLGGVDMTMWRNQDLLDQHGLRFLPAVNEDLAATIVMGTQQAGAHEDRKVDGVFSMWYGKGPGVDRAGDALHHGNAAGASRHGGVLLVVGDDHTAASSSIPHASEASLAAWRIPVVNPASIEEYERFGLWGWALSRYAGTWVAFKAVTETVESGRSFSLEPSPDFSLPQGDPHAGTLEYSAQEFLTPDMETRMMARLEAVKAFSRFHRLDRLADPAPDAKVGIVSTGKAFLDTVEALERLRSQAGDPGLLPIRHYKVGLVWPLDKQGLAEFAKGLDHILIIEEKHTLIESQIKDLAFNKKTRPSVCGRRDLEDNPLVPGSGQLQPDIVSTALRHWLSQVVGASLHAANKVRHETLPPLPSSVSLTRRPYFCSGCPHSTSTRVPEGSQALGGVGCHYMATWMDRSTAGLTQMGGEGADWIGLSPYIRTPHIFQNMGEGTYFHSGYLAIRQSIAAKANITYKILFNDAVAMTGGQAVDGVLSVPQICQQLRGEGVEHIVITADDPERYKGVALPAGVKVHHRRALDQVQRGLRAIPGVTVLIHDQVCAAEKRRRRKHKTYPDPARRLVINTAVCEGCGDCGVQSNCLSLMPVETPLGRKRAIDQSSCNKDYTCVDGFCPSFVSVIGGRPRRKADTGGVDAALLENQIRNVPTPDFTQTCGITNVLVVGVGGTGVVTVGAVLAMAAHLQGRAASVLDITGLAQKGGAVVSHVRLSPNSDTTGSVRIDKGEANVAIVSDPVAGSTAQVLSMLRHGHTRTVVNRWVAPTAEFTHDPDVDMSVEPMLRIIEATAGPDSTSVLDAHTLAQQHFGDSILANMMLLGFVWQCGGIPLTEAAIMRALELNGVAVQKNQDAFRLGRLAAHQPDTLSVGTQAQKPTPVIHASESLADVKSRCLESLTAYQNRAWAQRWLHVVEAVAQAESRVHPHRPPRLAAKAGKSLHKLMTYKDEYEVARLFSNGDFRRQLADEFEGEYSLQFHLAPPLLARRDPRTGIPRKVTFGPWLEKSFAALAHGKHLRGSWLDVFGYTHERRTERRLVRDYSEALLTMSEQLSAHNFGAALELAELPMQIRGFGHIKLRNVETFDLRMNEIMQALGTGDSQHSFLHFPV